MGLSKTIWSKPIEYLTRQAPEAPVMFFAPGILQDTARRYIDGFPGQVSYAVKANPSEGVIANLAATGLRRFDIGSNAEIALIRRLVPEAQLQHSNPVRSQSEIAFAVANGVGSYMVDSYSELAKLIAQVPPGTEIAVQFSALPTNAKFGASAELAKTLLIAVENAGLIPALAFQIDRKADAILGWNEAMNTAAKLQQEAGVKVAKLHIGGGLPALRSKDDVAKLKALFEEIQASAIEAFGQDLPELACAPGRGMVAECCALACRVKALRDAGDVFLNDGHYGRLRKVDALTRLDVLAPDGAPRNAPPMKRRIFGPSCDEADRVPVPLALPADLVEGDYLLFHGLGAYSIATQTQFNGSAEAMIETVLTLR